MATWPYWNIPRFRDFSQIRKMMMKAKKKVWCHENKNLRNLNSFKLEKSIRNFTTFFVRLAALIMMLFNDSFFSKIQSTTTLNLSSGMHSVGKSRK